MAQRLALPLNTTNITVGYKDEAPNYYLLKAGWRHYGTDMTGTSNCASHANDFFASGNGVILGYNTDANQTVGRWLAIKYTDVEGYGDLVVRYFHLEKIHITSGSVNLDSKIARYGNTGPYSKGYHLHVEVDTDVEYWNYTPTISGASGDLRAGTADQRNSQGQIISRETSTRNPLAVFRVKKTAPEKQSFKVAYDGVDDDNYRYNVRTPLNY